MKRLPILTCIFFALGHIVFDPFLLQAQRAHEIQFQFGVSLNKGVSFYDYVEAGGTKRYNFEFDQRLMSFYYRVNWLFPVNGSFDAGLYFASSLSTRHQYIEAESFLFDSDKPGERLASPLYTGESRFNSNTKEFGVNAKICLARFGKFKTYALINPGWLSIKVFKNDPSHVVQAEHPGLRQNLFDTYTIHEDLFVIGYCVGISYRLAPGITITILEASGKNNLKDSRLIPSTPSFDIRSGLAYQFYRRK